MTGRLLADGSVLVGGSFEGRGLVCDGSVGIPLLMQLDRDLVLRDTTVFRGTLGEIRGIAPHGNRWALLKREWTFSGPCRSTRTASVELWDANTGDAESFWRGSEYWHRPGGLVPVRTHEMVLLFRNALDRPQLEKLGPDGATEWVFEPPSGEQIISLDRRPDGALFAVANTGERRYALTMLSERGETIRRTVVEGDDVTTAWDLSATDAGAVVLGRLRVPESGRNTLLVTHLGATGQTLWEYRLDEGSPDPAVMTVLDSGYIAFGYHPEDPNSAAGPVRSVITILDPRGKLLTSAPFGPASGTVVLRELLPAPDGRLIAIGSVGPEEVGIAGTDFDILVAAYVLR